MSLAFIDTDFLRILGVPVTGAPKKNSLNSVKIHKRWHNRFNGLIVCHNHDLWTMGPNQQMRLVTRAAIYLYLILVKSSHKGILIPVLIRKLFNCFIVFFCLFLYVTHPFAAASPWQIAKPDIMIKISIYPTNISGLFD